MASQSESRRAIGQVMRLIKERPDSNTEDVFGDVIDGYGIVMSDDAFFQICDWIDVKRKEADPDYEPRPQKKRKNTDLWIPGSLRRSIEVIRKNLEEIDRDVAKQAGLRKGGDVHSNEEIIGDALQMYFASLLDNHTDIVARRVKDHSRKAEKRKTRAKAPKKAAAAPNDGPSPALQKWFEGLEKPENGIVH